MTLYSVTAIETDHALATGDEQWVVGRSQDAADDEFVFRGAPMKVLEGEFLPSCQYAVIGWHRPRSKDACTKPSLSDIDTALPVPFPCVRKTGLFVGVNGALPNSEAQAYILAFAQIVDYRPELAAYRDAIVDFLPTYRARYLVMGRPEAMVEGVWRERLSLAVIEFPSVDAAVGFWTSDRYQKEIKPMRAGTGVFDVAVFDAS